MEINKEIELGLEHFETCKEACDTCCELYESFMVQLSDISDKKLLERLWGFLEFARIDYSRDETQLWLMIPWRRIIALHQLASKEMFDTYCHGGVYLEWLISGDGQWVEESFCEELEDFENLLTNICSNQHFNPEEHSLTEIARQRHRGQGIWQGSCELIPLEDCERCLPILEEVAETEDVEVVGDSPKPIETVALTIQLKMEYRYGRWAEQFKPLSKTEDSVTYIYTSEDDAEFLKSQPAGCVWALENHWGDEEAIYSTLRPADFYGFENDFDLVGYMVSSVPAPENWDWAGEMETCVDATIDCQDEDCEGDDSCHYCAGLSPLSVEVAS